MTRTVAGKRRIEVMGDPIAMLLYIIYVEPLLVKLEANLTGLRFSNVKEI